MEHVPIPEASEPDRETIVELARKCNAAGQERRSNRAAGPLAQKRAWTPPSWL